MKIDIHTNHHFYESSYFDYEQLLNKFSAKKENEKRYIEESLFSSLFSLTTKNKDLSQLKIIGFKENKNKLEQEEQLILKLFSTINQSEKRYAIQTGLYAGVVYHKGFKFNIQTDYGNTFLQRMLNFVNDIYIDTKEIKALRNENYNEFQYIIAYLLIQSLEKASVLGLPKEYKQTSERSSKVKGKIDLNAYLKRDLPFQGKLTSSYRTQTYITEIIDVLYASIIKAQEYLGVNYKSKIIGVFQTLKEHCSNSFVTQTTINKAKNHSVLYNPIFSQFKEVLYYAEILLKNQDIQSNEQSAQISTYGFLFDISQLFEVYLEKLLKRHFTEWSVNGQEEVQVYKRLFYKRKMFPDIIMRHKVTQEIIVFDAKFKKMYGRNKDLDRSDFFQIHTYMQYYMPDIIVGGLIYPLSKDFKDENLMSRRLFNENKNPPNFIVEGIYVNMNMDMESIIESEKNFLNRLDKYIESTRLTMAEFKNKENIKKTFKKIFV